MHALKTLAILALTIAPVSGLASSDLAAEVLDFSIDDERCMPAVIDPPPGPPWDPIEVEHCVDIEADFHIVRTSAGISIGRVNGTTPALSGR